MSISAKQLKHEITTVKNYLTAAQDIMKSGHMPDLSGLENRVAVICDSLENAEPDVQKQCLPELTVLLEHLNVCEKEMHASQKNLKEVGEKS